MGKGFFITIESFPRYHYRLFRATMYTTVVPESLGGRGLAKLLADKAFDFAVREQVAKSIPY